MRSGPAPTAKPAWRRRAAASGRLLGVRARLVLLFRLRLLSDRRALAGRSVLSALGVRHRLAGVAVERRAATSARSISSSCCRSCRSCCCTARRLSGLRVVPTALWGGILVTIVVATVGIVFSLPLGILLALGRRSDLPVVRLVAVAFIEFVRGVPLITVLFMASVMLPLFVPEQLRAGQAGARADRRRAVCLRLHGGSGARRPGRGPARPIRGGARARA